MAPNPNKRAASRAPTEEPSAKRIADFLAQQGITKASYQPVLDTVQHPLSGLPEITRQMVLATLPWSIAVPADERSAAQQGVVCMVGEIVDNVQAELQNAVDVESGKVDELLSTRTELAAAVQRAENADAEARQAVEEQNQLLTQAEAATLEKRAAVQKMEFEEKRLRAELEQRSAQVSEVQEVISESFERLKNGNYEDIEVEKLVQGVMAVAAKCSLEESLMLSLPTSLAKRGRGTFDEAVINQAEQSFQSKLESLRDSATAAEGPLAAQVTASQMAQAELDGAMADQAQAEDKLRSTRDTSAEAAAAQESAKCTLAQLESKLETATASQGVKSAELEQFRSYNVCMFNSLRDRVPQKADASEDVAADSTKDTETIAAPSKDVSVAQGTETACLAGA